MSGASPSSSSNPLNSVSPETSQPAVEKWQNITNERVEVVAGIVARHLEKNWDRDVLSAIDPNTVLPFATPILPANEAVLARAIPGYVPPTPELLEELTEYAKATENYGTAPGEAAAVIVQIVRALKPETAFVFGTARGRIEHDPPRFDRARGQHDGLCFDFVMLLCPCVEERHAPRLTFFVDQHLMRDRVRAQREILFGLQLWDDDVQAGKARPRVAAVAASRRDVSGSGHCRFLARRTANTADRHRYGAAA